MCKLCEDIGLEEEGTEDEGPVVTLELTAPLEAIRELVEYLGNKPFGSSPRNSPLYKLYDLLSDALEEVDGEMGNDATGVKDTPQMNRTLN